MGNMAAEPYPHAIMAGEKCGVVRDVFHAIGGGGEDFGEKRVVMNAFVVASLAAPVADADKRGDLPPGVMDAGERLVVVLKKEEYEFVLDAEKAGSHGGELQDRAKAMAHKALLEIVTEAFSLLRGPRGFVREDEDVGIKTGHDPRRAVSTTRVEAQPLTIGAKAFQDDVRVMGWHGFLRSSYFLISSFRLGRWILVCLKAPAGGDGLFLGYPGFLHAGAAQSFNHS
jgi:hypothetical protein